MEGKKISFGFMKTKKAEKPVVEEKKDFIECIDEKSIKVVGGEEVKEEKPLIIPMKPNTLITAERLNKIAEEVESALQEPEKEIKKESVDVPENESLDQMAVRELLSETNKEVKVENQALTVPVPMKPVMGGDKESSLEDYESVPVQDFGLAMLRGMGWTPGNEQSKYKQPELRPKGLGLGADKVIKENQKKKASKDNKEEELTIVKNSFVKITTGKYSGCYGKVLSLDEEMGRVLVDITMKKETVSLSEFMMQPVTKSEYDREHRVINADSFEEYKKKERSQNDPSKANNRESSNNRNNERYERQEKDRREENRRRDYSDPSNGRGQKERPRKDSRSSSEERSRQKVKDNRGRRDFSSEEERHKKKEERKRRDSSSSEDRSRQRRKEARKRRDSSSSEDRSRQRKRDDKKRRDTSSSEDRSRRRKKEKKKHSRRSSSSPETEKRKKHKSKNRRNSDSSDSDGDNEKRRKSPVPEKRDIDKKRKGKKKKRDRDRSPNYKKHRK